MLFELIRKTLPGLLQKERKLTERKSGLIQAILVLSEFVKEISAMKWQKTLVNSMLDAYKEVQVSELDALDDEPDYEFA